MNPQGLYSLASYGTALRRQMDSHSNNLANVETAGYKEDKPVFESLFSTTYGVPSQSDEERFAHFEHLPPYTGVGNSFVAVADMGKNMSQGRLTRTGSDLDLALVDSEGFFSIDTPQGERFSRAGNFRLNKDRQLVSAEGFLVNGKEGPLAVDGSKMEVSEDGSVIVDGERIGGLKIVAFPFPDRLQKMGNSLFAPVDADNGARILEDVKITQGFVETSNVDSFKEMIQLIQANRAYTSMQKAIRSADEMNQGAITLAEV